VRRDVLEIWLGKYDMVAMAWWTATAAWKM
jgi:hypothetical protein